MSGWSKKRGIMRKYNVTASIYDMRYAEEQEPKFAAAIEHVDLNKLDAVLDVGCGTGLLFPHVSEKAKMIVGVDISKETLSVAKQNAGHSQKVSLVLADADNLPLADGVFTHVFAFTLVQNMPNPAGTIGEMKRVSKLGAVIIVSALKKVFSKDSFERLLKDAGLKLIAIEDENLKCYVAVCEKNG